MRICIIGGGVVGLNIAHKLSALEEREIYLLEKEPYLGHHTSTRNSEVIHAGFAYPPSSLKAKLCVEGNKLTYEFLDELGVAYKKCGKWVIACGAGDDEALEATYENARLCGVPDFEYGDVAKLCATEPDLQNITKVIHSGSSGIMDAAGYIRALEVALSKRSNVNLVFPCKVNSIDFGSSQVVTDRGNIEYDILINSAGLWADDVFDMTVAESEKGRYKIVPFKGEYYTWKKGRIKTMIYPVPGRFLSKGKDATLVSSMGIHTHRNIAGELFLGPSQSKLSPDKKDDYKIENSAEYFAENVSHYLRDVRAGDLEPAYAGNRPKLYIDGEPYGDFKMFSAGNVIHLLGMESPALTAAPSIAKHVEGFL